MEETSSFWPKEETAEKSFLTWSLSNIKDKTVNHPPLSPLTGLEVGACSPG